MENTARKINLDLFLTDRCNENISPEYQKAYDALASLPELTDISIDSFLTELRERWDLLSPILGEQTETFLGYCKGDIETIQSFFTAEHFNGMDALIVQAALRAIWLKTPCSDNRLNFDLFKCVDDKFYGIIENLEQSFSLSNIPSILPEKFQDMISLETLELDWLARRKCFSEHFNLPEDVWDTIPELTSDTFPSCSGLFANPAPLRSYYDDCDILKFLNFWMPHLQKFPFNPTILLQNNAWEDLEDTTSVDNIKRLIYLTHLEYVVETLHEIDSTWLEPYKRFFDFLYVRFCGWLRLHNKEISFKLKDSLDDSIGKLDTIIPEDLAEADWHRTLAALWKESKNIFNCTLQEFYQGLQPTRFLTESPNDDDWGRDDTGTYTTFAIPGSNCAIAYIDQQLPRFINSCREYVVRDGNILRSPHLKFGAGEKFHLLENHQTSKLLEYFCAFDATLISLPVCSTADISKFESYYESCYLRLPSLNSELTEKISKCPWGEMVRAIFQTTKTRFENALLEYVKSIEKEDLSPANKLDILSAIEQRFSSIDPNFLAELNQIKQRIPGGGQTRNHYETALGNKIAYICQRDKSEQEEIKLKEAETRNKILDKMSHSIGNLLESIDSPLSNIKTYSNNERINSYALDAERGTQLIRGIATVMLQLRDIPGGWNWQKDFDITSGVNFHSILFDSLFYSINNMFNGKHFKKFNENYFPTSSVSENEYNRAERESKSANSLEELKSVLQKYFFNYSINISPAISNIKVGNNDYTATKFTMLLNEILTNAIKYASFVEREKRFLAINIKHDKNILSIEVKNAAQNPQEAYNPNGVGAEIIETFVRLFGATSNIQKEHEQYALEIKFQL